LPQIRRQRRDIAGRGRAILWNRCCLLVCHTLFDPDRCLAPGYRSRA
jgi:hypothetical protein